MADYYYTLAGERKGPVPEAELARLIQTGAIGPDEYYWTQGMSDWDRVANASFAATVPAATGTAAPSPVADHPEQEAGIASVEPVTSTPAASAPAPAAAQPASPAVSQPAASAYGGTGAFGQQADVVAVRDVANALPRPLWLLLPGILLIVSGIPYLIFLVGAIYIWMGVLLIQANSSLERARQQGSARELMTALGKINTLFVIVGVMMIISIALLVLFLLIIVVGGANF